MLGAALAPGLLLVYRILPKQQVVSQQPDVYSWRRKPCCSRDANIDGIEKAGAAIGDGWNHAEQHRRRDHEVPRAPVLHAVEGGGRMRAIPRIRITTNFNKAVRVYIRPRNTHICRVAIDRIERGEVGNARGLRDRDLARESADGWPVRRGRSARRGHGEGSGIEHRIAGRRKAGYGGDKITATAHAYFV